jgi:hypothetical protein
MSSLDKAVEYMGFEPSQSMEVDLKPYQDPMAGHEAAGYAHVALLVNGVTYWLNFMELADHSCVDVRTFREDAVYATGVFSISNGRRVIGQQDEPALRGHAWPAGYNVTLLSDRVPGDRQDTKPYTEEQE